MLKNLRTSNLPKKKRLLFHISDNHVQIPEANSIKYLDMHLDKKIDAENHVQAKKKRTWK